MQKKNQKTNKTTPFHVAALALSPHLQGSPTRPSRRERGVLDKRASVYNRLLVTVRIIFYHFHVPLPLPSVGPVRPRWRWPERDRRQGRLRQHRFCEARATGELDLARLTMPRQCVACSGRSTSSLHHTEAGMRACSGGRTHEVLFWTAILAASDWCLFVLVLCPPTSPERRLQGSTLPKQPSGAVWKAGSVRAVDLTATTSPTSVLTHPHRALLFTTALLRQPWSWVWAWEHLCAHVRAWRW